MTPTLCVLYQAVAREHQYGQYISGEKKNKKALRDFVHDRQTAGSCPASPRRVRATQVLRPQPSLLLPCISAPLSPRGEQGSVLPSCPTHWVQIQLWHRGGPQVPVAGGFWIRTQPHSSVEGVSRLKLAFVCSRIMPKVGSLSLGKGWRTGDCRTSAGEGNRAGTLLYH